MGKKFKVESSILVMAMRYAMGRQTFAPTTVVDSIKNNISLLDSNQIELLIRDIEEYGESFSFGMDCDERLWLDFRNYLVNVLGSKNKDSSKDIEAAVAVLKVMEDMRDNPDSIMHSRNHIGRVLSEWGIDIDEKSPEQSYKEFKMLVEYELLKD